MNANIPLNMRGAPPGSLAMDFEDAPGANVLGRINFDSVDNANSLGP